MMARCDMRILNGRVLGLGWDMMERLLGWEHLDCRSERGVVEVMGWLMGWLMGLAFSQLCVVVREPSAVRWAGMSLAFSQLGGVGVREGEGVFCWAEGSWREASAGMRAARKFLRGKGLGRRVGLRLRSGLWVCRVCIRRG